MSLKAGFAEIDITPPMGTQKVGWLQVLVAEKVLDPLYARAAVFESDGARIGFVQLDVLCVLADDVAEMRKRITERCGFPGQNVMISATHNHAGPAVVNSGDTVRDADYTESMMDKVVSAFAEATANMTAAELGFAGAFEFDVSFNRRTVMRDGTSICQQPFDNPNALYLEGPIDPELAVLAARRASGELLGTIVNFACHPTHHGEGTAISAGYPGVLAGEMKSRGCPVTMFLNGACGNIIFHDFTHGGKALSMEEVGTVLADDVTGALEKMDYRDSVRLATASRTEKLPYRRFTEDDIKGTSRGAQRYGSPGVYDRAIPRVLKRIEALGTEPVEVQVHSLDEYAFAAIPAEYFVEHGLAIKERSHPRHALVVSCANGMVGYVPTADAFRRGGYETTFGDVSRLAPEAGEMLADAAIRMIHDQQ